MASIPVLLEAVAVFALIGVGLATTIGADGLRRRLLRFFVGIVCCLVFAGPVMNLVLTLYAQAVSSVVIGDTAVGLPMVFLVLVGHMVLGIALLRRRFGGAERARRLAGEAERVRGRERVRLPLDGE